MPDAIYPQFATHNAATMAAILQMARAPVHRLSCSACTAWVKACTGEVLKNPLVACRVYAPVGAHRDLLAYLVRRLLENGANSSFVHQLADETVGMEDLLISPLRLEPHSPAAAAGSVWPAARQQHGLDLTVPAMREPLLAAYATAVARGA
jgi:RHH-type proline utilization regulon transcriptional repressor/proline dehydrogenase/delta 1-pyrroline-5-carboxylate dehydrogenase